MSTSTAPHAAEQSRPRRQALASLGAPARRFVATEAGSAGLLLAATLVALAWANSPWSGSYEALWDTELTIQLGGWELSKDLRHWLDEGLMALFFFVIGLEVRRELAVGELRDRSRVALPVIAGLGGMALPALLYLLVAPGDAHHGWGIVIATDTAFLLGALAIIGPACPSQLRVFLLTLSIVDDIVAISVIGVAYSEALAPVPLAVAGACLLALVAMQRLHVWHAAAYVVVGGALWLATDAAGLHPTIAGMAGGLLIAAYAPFRHKVERAARAATAFRQSPLPTTARETRRLVARSISLNERLQNVLHPWTSYVIVPLFALANAGVDLRGGMLGDALASPLTWAIVAGLVVGKLVGIAGGALGALRLRLGALPQGVGEGQVVGGAALSGIGFTVSLLIVGLAFDADAYRDEARVGVLLAAALAVVVGWLAFKLAAVLRGEVTAGLPVALTPPVDPDRDHVAGPPDAPLTLVEYGDFECPFCGRATGVVRELRARFGDELRYVWRHLPLPDVHPHAELAAEAAEAAGEQGRFWEMHALLFANQDELELQDLLGYAGRLGLDVEAFARALEAGRHGERVHEDMASAEASGARGTPTFFVGGRRHVGPYDAATLAAALEASRDGAAAALRRW